MAKLSRVFQNLFGLTGDASHFEQFGARAGGVANFTKDPNTLQSLSAFIANGWKDAVNPSNNAPFLEDMNGLFYLLFYQICYGLQEGVPEYNSATTYFVGSIVKKTGTTELYGSLTDNNTGNALPSQTSNGNWNYLNPTNNPPGQISDFGGTSAPFGWLACDGTVYAQASFPNLFAAIGSTWNIGGEGAGNFRVPDLRGRTTIGLGQGSGLTNRVIATLLGEETHALVASETSALAHTHPMSHYHATGLAQQGAQLMIAASNPGGYTTRSLSYWVQGVAGIAAPASLTYLNTDPSSISDTGAAAYSGVGTTGAGHNNMQPTAVALKMIKT